MPVRVCVWVSAQTVYGVKPRNKKGGIQNFKCLPQVQNLVPPRLKNYICRLKNYICTIPSSSHRKPGAHKCNQTHHPIILPHTPTHKRSPQLLTPPPHKHSDTHAPRAQFLATQRPTCSVQEQLHRKSFHRDDGLAPETGARLFVWLLVLAIPTNFESGSLLPVCVYVCMCVYICAHLPKIACTCIRDCCRVRTFPM